MSEKRKFRVEARWNEQRYSQVVTATDACEALDNALPGSWKMGQYDRAEISIHRVPDDTPEDF